MQNKISEKEFYKLRYKVKLTNKVSSTIKTSLEPNNYEEDYVSTIISFYGLNYYIFKKENKIYARGTFDKNYLYSDFFKNKSIIMHVMEDKIQFMNKSKNDIKQIVLIDSFKNEFIANDDNAIKLEDIHSLTATSKIKIKISFKVGNQTLSTLISAPVLKIVNDSKEIKIEKSNRFLFIVQKNISTQLFTDINSILSFYEKKNYIMKIDSIASKWYRGSKYTVFNPTFHMQTRKINEVIKNSYFYNRLTLKTFIKRIILKLIVSYVPAKQYTYLEKTKYILKNHKSTKRYYANNYDKVEIEKDTYLVECSNGRDLISNMFYLVQELSKQNKKVCCAINKIDLIQNKIDYYNIKNVEFIEKSNTSKYCDALLKSEYILIDTSLPLYFVKKEGQKVFNTWHGTPFKAMGRQISNEYSSMRNVQRSLLMSDKLLVNNEMTAQTMKNEYMLDMAYRQNVEVLPEPKFSGLLNQSRRVEIRSELKLSSTDKLLVWMPTWHGSNNGNLSYNDKQKNINLFKSMNKLIKYLNNDIKFYVKPHPFIYSLINKEDFEMNFIDDKYEIYDFLTAADILLTDFSSIFYDFAVTQKKIILDHRYKRDYYKTREMNRNAKEVKLKTVNRNRQLINEINSELDIDQNYYEEFNLEYNPQCSINNASNFIDYIEKEQEYQINNKKTVLISPGSLATNGITSSFLAFIELVSKKNSNTNYIIVLRQGTNSNINALKIEPYLKENVKFIYLNNHTLVSDDMYIKNNNVNKRLKVNNYEELIDGVYRKEISRVFPNLKIDQVIHYSLYDQYYCKLFSAFDENIKKSTIVHNDLEEEYNSKWNFSYQAINHFMNKCNKIAVVSQEIYQPTLDYFDVNKEQLHVVPNYININQIIEKSYQEVEYITEEINEILSDDNIHKFICIARFSYEKGIDRLLESYDYMRKKYGNVHLFLVGSDGLYSDKLYSSDLTNITILKDINPFPLLAKCNTMVMSSRYEGQGLVLLEAATLKIHAGAPNIKGPIKLGEMNYCKIFENSVDGIKDFMEGAYKGQYGYEINDTKIYTDEIGKVVLEFAK